MIITTTRTIEGTTIATHRGIGVAGAILGAAVIRDVFAGIPDILGERSTASEEELGKAAATALTELENSAHELCAGAVVGIDVDYEGINSMPMVSVSGTAVTLSDD